MGRTISSHKFCFVCKKLSGTTSFSVIRDETVIELLINKHIYIPFGSRCCVDHLTENRNLKECELKKISLFRETSELSSKDVNTLLVEVRLRESKNATIFSRFEDFQNISNDFVQKITGTKAFFFS